MTTKIDELTNKIHQMGYSYGYDVGKDGFCYLDAYKENGHTHIVKAESLDIALMICIMSINEERIHGTRF